MKTALLRKAMADEFYEFVVDKTIKISKEDYNRLEKNPFMHFQAITENRESMFVDEKDVWHCIFLYADELEDGLLVEAEGSNYMRYWTYYPKKAIL